MYDYNNNNLESSNKCNKVFRKVEQTRWYVLNARQEILLEDAIRKVR
jgi:hypothetical protein